MDGQAGAGGLYDEALTGDLRRGVARVAAEWGLSARTGIALLSLSENATFRADDPERSAPVVFRVHRPDYHTDREIVSELAWIDALRREQVVATPEPLPRRDGGRIGFFAAQGQVWRVAAFAFAPGVEPTPGAALVPAFRQLGAISARLHTHARRWRRPHGFRRKVWRWETMLGRRGHWGDWRTLPGLGADGARLIDLLADDLRLRLAAYGTGSDRFGLIHADLRLANLLAAGEMIRVIDFDDCGFGWFLYDFAAAVSFMEHEAFVPDLAAAWMEGYRQEAPLPPEAEAMLPAMVMLRRLLLTAWIASRHETATARAAAVGWAEATLTLADGFLRAR